MSNFENLDLRIEIKNANVTFRELARQMHITPEWFSTIMAKPLSSENEAKIREALKSLEEVE